MNILKDVKTLKRQIAALEQRIAALEAQSAEPAQIKPKAKRKEAASG